eukprot:TRINITY_DN9652_c0_g1_i2.p1 TRINITY_DN9652_c0_g1~~TRINITY_DN9652_c0_g1_i2.p1  ORF type:complete len:421 (+),score=130.69 TRINITY_DN9652_c0_g1_i2:74-1264(+)
MDVPDHVAQAAAVLQSAVGCRVRRNPEDWEWGDQDGGDGKLGTIVDVSMDGWAGVEWDAGGKDGYRFGAQGKWDVLFVSPPEQKEGGGDDGAAAASDPAGPAAPPAAAASDPAGPAAPAAAAASDPGPAAAAPRQPVLRLSAGGDGLGPSVEEILLRPFHSVWPEYPMLRELGVAERMAADWVDPPFMLVHTLKELRKAGAFAPQGAQAGAAAPPAAAALPSPQPAAAAAPPAAPAAAPAPPAAPAAAAAPPAAPAAPRERPAFPSAPPDVQEALGALWEECEKRRVWEAEGGEPDEGRPDPFHIATDTMLTLAQNVVNEPAEQKYRRINQRNRAYHMRLGLLKGSRRVMLLLGFKDTCELTEDGEEASYWLMPAGIVPNSGCVAALSHAASISAR